MIDYFALLDQPRAPWLDPAELKERFHQKTLAAHPDTQKGGGANDNADAIFASLNEAYQVLRDPKRRLHHFLSLEGAAPSSGGKTVPKQLEDLFPEVGLLSQHAQILSEKLKTASNALSISLLKPQIFKLQSEAKGTREKLQALADEASCELQALSEAGSASAGENLKRVTNLYYIFAYLTRWTAQLDEIQFQLSQH